jgi:ribonuclease Z
MKSFNVTLLFMFFSDFMQATFDDGMLPEAVKKNHSITKEAIDVGLAAGVYRIFLTHFSQRYPAVPVFDTSYNDITSIAFDMMTVNLADLPVVPQLLPAFRLLFSLPPEDEDPLTL